jgi:hypothetical protein
MAPKRGRRLQKGPLQEEPLVAPPPRRALICIVLLVALAVSGVSFYLLAGLSLGLEGGAAAAAGEGGPVQRALRGGGEVFATAVPVPSRAPPPPAADNGLKPGETFCTPDHCGEGASRGAKFTWP